MATDFAKFARAHHFYTDAVSFDYQLPSDIISALGKDPKFMPFLGGIINDSYENAEKTLSRCVFGLEEIEESFKAMLLALALAPKKRQSQYDNKDYEEFKARKELLRSLEEKCLSAAMLPVYLYSFGQLYLKMGEVKKAVELFEKALAINPAFKRAHIPLAVIYTIAEDYDKGLIHAKAAREAGLELAANLLETCLTVCGIKKNIRGAGRMRLDSLSEGDTEAAIAYFPKMEGEIDHESHGRKVIVAGCDPKYFHKHVIALAASLEANDPDSALHIHVTNPDQSVAAAIKEMREKLKSIKILVSTDTADYKEFMNDLYYLSTVRDIRLYQLVKQNSNRFIRLDADSLIVKRLDGKLMGKDIVLPYNFSGHMPYWERIINGLKSVQRSERSLKFLGDLALLIADNFKNKTHLWFQDQIYTTYLFDKYEKELDIGLADMSLYMDLSHSDKSFIWTVTHDKNKSIEYLRKKHGYLNKYGLAKYIDAEELKAAETV